MSAVSPSSISHSRWISISSTTLSHASVPMTFVKLVTSLTCLRHVSLPCHREVAQFNYVTDWKRGGETSVALRKTNKVLEGILTPKLLPTPRQRPYVKARQNSVVWHYADNELKIIRVQAQRNMSMHFWTTLSVPTFPKDLFMHKILSVSTVTIFPSSFYVIFRSYSPAAFSSEGCWWMVLGWGDKRCGAFALLCLSQASPSLQHVRV